MKERHHFTFRAHILFLFLYLLCSLALFWFSPKDVGFSFGLSLMLVWNCFLSFLPVLFARRAVASRDKGSRLWPLWVFLWIIFWPNAFYLVTDAAHFSGNSFCLARPYQSPIYSTQIQLWVKAIMIITGILYGAINGVTSELFLEGRMTARCGSGKRIAFRAVCSALGGIAIYIGRFLRLNSWDIFRPMKLIAAMCPPQGGWFFSLRFSGAFAVFIFLVLSFAKPLVRENTK